MTLPDISPRHMIVLNFRLAWKFYHVFTYDSNNINNTLGVWKYRKMHNIAYQISFRISKSRQAVIFCLARKNPQAWNKSYFPNL